MKCLIYIDLNMVRNGVVNHTSEWLFGGYNKIQKPRKKSVIIANKTLSELAGFQNYRLFREFHQEMVNTSISSGNNFHQAEWTKCIAVGSENFVTNIKNKLGIKAKGRRIFRS